MSSSSVGVSHANQPIVELEVWISIFFLQQLVDRLCIASCGLEAVGMPHNRGFLKDQGTRMFSFVH